MVRNCIIGTDYVFTLGVNDMKKFIILSPKEVIELSCPDNLAHILKVLLPHIKAKTVKIKNGTDISAISINEY